MPNAGDIIRASDVAHYSDLTTLTQDSPSVIDTWEDWATETVTITDPGVPVKVKAWLNGRLINTTDAASTGEMRVSISLDGGSTFDDGNTSGIVNTGTGAGNAVRQSAGAVHLLAGTPTGDVVVKAQMNAGDTDVDFSSGVLLVEVAPQ